MAIGDFNNNSTNNNGKMYEGTYFSRLKFKNVDSKLTLTPSFRSGLLILDIAEQKEGFKYDSIGNIYLSPTKARIFANEIIKFKEYLASGNIVPGKAFGVNAGMNDKVSFIALHADTDKNIFVTIGKFDSNGNIVEQATITLNKDYHFALEWDNLDSMDVAKAFDNDVEIDQLYDLVYDFGRSMSGAEAYSYIDLGRYDYGRILRKMDPIYDKLGIERRTMSSGENSYKSNSFLNNSKSVNSNHTTIDDMEDLLD